VRSYRITGCGAEQDRFCGVHLVPFDPLLRHLPLHQLLVCPEINSIPASLTAEGRDLSLVNSGDPIGSVDLLDGIPRTSIQSGFIGLSLQTCGREGNALTGVAAPDGMRGSSDHLSIKRTYGCGCVQLDQTRPSSLNQR